MLKRFSTVFAFLFAISLASSFAQTFTYNTGTIWQAAGGWTAAMGAVGFPGQASNNGDVTISNTATVGFTDAPPAFPISSLVLSGTMPVSLGAGTLTITGNFTLNAGATLNINAGVTVVVNGTSTIAGTINLATATSRIIFNGPVVQTGAGVINAGANAATVQLGAGVGSISGGLFQNPYTGTLQTGGALNLTASLTMGAASTLNLVGTTTLASGVTLTFAAATATITGAGNLQGAAANSTVNMTAGPTALQGTWFANPFNGTLQTPNAASTLAGTLTIGSTGILNIGTNGLSPAATGTNLILNNTAANSLTGGAATAVINVTADLTVTLGPGFNGGTLNGDRFANPILGRLNTGGNLTATGAGTPILQFGNGGATGIFDVTGTLTIAANRTIFINNTAMTALPGTGSFAATDNTSILRFVAGANGGRVSGTIFSNPWNGRLRIDGNLELGATAFAGSSVLNVGPNGILDLGGNLQVNDSLVLNCTQPVSGAGAAFQGGAGFITALAGGPSTGAPGPGGRVTIGAGTFAGTFPAGRLGTGTNWAAGNLFIAGASALNTGNYTLDNGAFLFLNAGSVLQVASNRTLTLNGRLLGTGAIDGQDNTATVTLGLNFSNAAGNGNIPGANFANPFNGNLIVTLPRTLNGNLTMGANSIYDTGIFATTVNAPSVLTLNQTAAAGLAGTGSFGGTGTIVLGNNALGATFPVAAIPSPAFSGLVILGDNVNFAANYDVQNATRLQLNGTSQINAAVVLTISNGAANTLSGTGRFVAQTAASEVNFAAGANGGVVPGANFASPYVGRIVTNGAMNLTGNLNMGATSVLNLAGVGSNLTVGNTSVLTLGMTAAPVGALPGAGLLVGQPSGANVPEIILASGALGGQVPIPGDIVTGAAATEFGGRLSVGTGYAVTANTAINQPAILNIQTGSQLLVNAGVRLSLNTTNSPATGTGTGTIQGQDNTAIVEPGNGFNGGTLPGALFSTPFSGQLIIPTNGLNLTGNMTMGVASILLMNGNLNVNPGTTLTLTGGTNSLQSGGGLLNGSNNTAVVALSAAFNGGTVPANRFFNPFSGTLTTAGPMTLSGAMTFGAPSSLTLGGNLIIPAATTLALNMNGANSVTGTGTFASAAATSTVALGTNFNNSTIPGTNFTNFGGVVTMASSLNLGSNMILGATGVLDLGNNINRLSLGASTLSVANPIRSTSATSFIVTNGAGGLTINNSALTSFFYPIGTAMNTYTPLVLSNASAADVFNVRARAGITNLPATYPNFVNVEWVITQAGSGTRTLRLAPQWAAANQQGNDFRTAAVGLGIFANDAYTESATGATTTVSGLNTFTGGTFTANFNGVPLVAFSKVVIPPAMVIQPVITAISPASVPVSNDGFTVTITGSNLGSVRVITARNNTSNALVNGTITLQAPNIITVSFPGIVRGVAGTLSLNVTNSTIPGFATTSLTVTGVSNPQITGFTPATTASGTAFTLLVNGTGFLSQARVTVNESPARVMSATTATSVGIEIPAALNNTSGSVRIRVVNTDGVATTANYTIGVPTRPNITNINPRAVFAGSNDVTISIEGTGFFAPGFITAFFSSAQIPVSVISSTRLTLTVPASLLTQVGNPSILITNSDNQSIGYVFSILERAPQGPTPVITSFTPSSTTSSNRAFTVTINGSNFNPRALVTIRGNVVTPVSLEANRVIVVIPGNLNTATPTDIVIQNPDLQFTTATVNIGTALPAPVLSSITPLTTVGSVAPGRAFTITVSGSNFNNASVLLNGQPLQIVSQSATSIVAIVSNNRPPVVNFDPAVNNIVVLNGDGQVTPPATLIVTTLVSVLDNTLPGFSVFPSPVQDMMTIQGGFDRPVNATVTISNILGQRVMSFTEQASGAYSRQVNVSNLPVGSYIVEINDGTRRMVQKVIKY